MVVNSINFWLFFAAVVVPYFLCLRGQRGQNLWLLLASYVFYGWADWKILTLLVGVTAVLAWASFSISSTSASSSRSSRRCSHRWVFLVASALWIL